MCIRFEDRLNDDILMSVATLKLCEFVKISKRAQKSEEICKSKRQSDREFSKRGSHKLAQTFPSKKFRCETNRSTTPSEFTGRDKPRQSNLKSVNSPTATVGSVRNVEKIVPICDDCG